MGEFADYALDECLDFEDSVYDYLHGNMDVIEAFDIGIVDEYGGFNSPKRPKLKSCRCCGKGGLTWGSHGGKWRLFDGGQVHKCAVNPLSDLKRP